jgi:hypothetical protein
LLLGWITCQRSLAGVRDRKDLRHPCAREGVVVSCVAKAEAQRSCSQDGKDECTMRGISGVVPIHNDLALTSHQVPLTTRLQPSSEDTAGDPRGSEKVEGHIISQ